ncbi:11865_t:CDS:2 [Gigaspora margarita]|uniref:11865_t:CDS:1 n=1 Tax=Gigaspora margarita TaxID=4874 RepID=A0ABM8VZQ8_GIGMA|nr:11865_t:CDS:2 [Gigaspora margarita]
MQTEAALHETQAESKESALNEENTYEEKVEIPSNTVESPITANTSSDVEMVAESSDPLRDEPMDLNGNAENKENLPPVVVEANTNMGDMQASMLSQW